MSSRTRQLILAIATVGFCLATASAWVHYRVLTDPSYVSPCDINATFSCTQVYLSRFGSVHGVPVALGGMIWFALVALVAGFARPSDKSSVAAGYLFVIATVGLAVILYLGYVSFVLLHVGCVLCMGTYVCVVAIFLLASSTASISILQLPLRVMTDIRSVLTRPVTLVAAILYLTGAVSAVALFREGSRSAVQAAEAPPTADATAAFATAWNAQPRVDLGVAPNGAKVVIVKFNDYECPACQQAELWYKPILDKFAKSNPGAVKYVLKDWPWNATCNFNATSTIRGHEASCDAAAAARMAIDRGKYDEMAGWLFANQETTPAAVHEAATRILGVTDFDQEYKTKLTDIQRDVADGGVLHIDSTPTFFIDGVRLPAGLIPPQYFELAINLELKKAS